MSVTASGALGDALFVPFRSARRGGEYGSDPVGSVFADLAVAGAAGGGTATITLSCAKIIFGFHPIFVPTYITTQDDLATPEEVLLIYDPAGNERLSAGNGPRESKLAVAASGGNFVLFDAVGLLIEPSEEATTNVLDVVWSTNTDAKTYHLHVYGVLFDAEIMARSDSRLSELFMGIR